MKTVRTILESKTIKGVYTIHPLATVFEAVALLSAHNIAALVVTEGDLVRGVFSERDCVQRVSLRERPLRHTRVYEVMDDDVACFSPETSIQECMQYMTECRKRHVPVLLDETLIGLVSIGDVVREYIADREFTIDQLQSYILS